MHDAITQHKHTPTHKSWANMHKLESLWFTIAVLSQRAQELISQSRNINKDKHEGPCVLQHSIGDVRDLDVQANSLLIAKGKGLVRLGIAEQADLGVAGRLELAKRELFTCRSMQETLLDNGMCLISRG